MNNPAATITRQTVLVNERIEINPIEQIGLETAYKVVREYLSLKERPFMDDDTRREWVAKRLQKVRQRYFEPI